MTANLATSFNSLLLLHGSLIIAMPTGNPTAGTSLLVFEGALGTVTAEHLSVQPRCHFCRIGVATVS